MAPSTFFLCPSLIDTPFEKGGEFSVWIFCVVAPIASYKAFEFSKKTLQSGLDLANTEANKPD
jgi:hypothetical protein